MLSPLLMTRIFIHYRDQEERGLKHFPFKQPFWNFRHGVESEVNDERFSGFLYWKKRNFTCKRLVGRCTFIIRTFYYPQPYVETGTMGIDDKTIQPVILTQFWFIKSIHMSLEELTPVLVDRGSFGDHDPFGQHPS